MNQYAINDQTGDVAEYDGAQWRVIDKARVARDDAGSYAVFDGKQWNKIGSQDQTVMSSPQPTPSERQQADYLSSQPNLGGSLSSQEMLTQGRDYIREVPNSPLRQIHGMLGNYVDAAMLGGADETLAALESLPALVPGGASYGGEFQRQLARLEQQRRDYNAVNAAQGKVASGAGIVGSPINLVGAEGIAAARSIPGRMARGATMGGAIGGTTGALATQGSIEDRAKGAGLGAAMGGAGGGVLPILSAVAAPTVRPEIQALMQRGITPTPGQIMGGAFNAAEEKVSSIPILGDIMAAGRNRSIRDFNRAVYNDVLEPLGRTVPDNVPVGRDGIRYVEQAASQEYERVLPNLTFQVDQQLASDIGRLRGMAQNLPPAEADRFSQIYRNEVLSRLQGSGTMDGRTFKELESQLGTLIKTYAGRGTADQQLLADALRELQATMRTSLERTNPMFAPQLQAANSAWARFVRLQRAAGALGKDDPGIFSPAQFQSAVKASDPSVRKGAFARGDALMQELSDAGVSVLGNKVPNSGTPARLLMAALGIGGTGVVSPGLMTGGALAALPYTPIGQRAAAALMTARPEWLRGIGQLLPQLVSPAGSASGQVGGTIASPSQVR